MDLMNILTYILAQFGGPAVLVLFLAPWLGKVWASRILEGDRHRYATEMEELKAQLQLETRHKIVILENELNAFKEKELKSHHDKVEIYRSVFVPIIELIGDLERIIASGESISLSKILDFSHNRLKIHAELALFAPQDVLDKWDALIDFLIDCLKHLKEGKYTVNNYQEKLWVKFRELAFDLINTMRADVGLAKGNVGYKGNL